MRKLIALLLVFSLLALSGNLYAKERRGAELIVEKKDGQSVRGELITVKENSLLLLSDSGADVSVEIGDVKIITIVYKSKFWKGAGYGLLAGGACGVAGGIIGGDDSSSLESFSFSTENKAVIAGIALGLAGVVLGGIIGASEGKDEIILIEGMSNSQIKKALEKLRKKARVRNFQ